MVCTTPNVINPTYDMQDDLVTTLNILYLQSQETFGLDYQRDMHLSNVLNGPMVLELAFYNQELHSQGDHDRQNEHLPFPKLHSRTYSFGDKILFQEIYDKFISVVGIFEELDTLIQFRILVIEFDSSLSRLGQKGDVFLELLNERHLSKCELVTTDQLASLCVVYKE